MACLNTNLPEYKALANVFGDNAKTKIYIKKWQKQFKSDEYPTVEFLQNMIQLQGVKNKEKKDEFVNILFANLIDSGFIEQKGQNFYIKPVGENNNSLYTQKEFIKNYLTFNDLPFNMLNFRKIKDGIIVSVNENNFSTSDIIQKSRSKDLLNTSLLLSHLRKVFPDVNITYISEKDAEQLFMSIPLSDRTIDDFSAVKSFYDPNTKTSYLIEERVDDETAIEEVMHPFVDALNIDNNNLFENLYKESSKNFPELKNKINQEYSSKYGFTELDRKKELVSKSMARHFKQEYETKPTKTFLDRVKDFVTWFLDNIVNSLHKLLNGKNISKIGQSVVSEQGIEAVSKLFKSDPELANQVYKTLGFRQGVEEITPQQKQQAQQIYSQYVNTIFPNSKVKDIRFHGVLKGRKAYNNIKEKGFNFDTPLNWGAVKGNGGMFFSDYNTAFSYGANVYKNPDRTIKPDDPNYMLVEEDIIYAKLNIEFLETNLETSSSIAAKFYEKNKDKKNIGMYGLEGGSEGVHFNHVVFKPEQIHILGSKKDILQFKDYVSKSTTQSTVQEDFDGPVFNVSDINPETTLSDIAKMLNTSDITIDLSKRIDGRLQFALSKEKNKQLKQIKRNANEIQKRVIDKLTGVDIQEKFKTNSFVVTNKKSVKDIVELTNDGEFYNPITKTYYKSSREIVNGIDADADIKKLNFDIAKDINTMMEGLVSNVKLDDMKQNFLELGKEEYKEKIENIYNTLAQIKRDKIEENSVLVPNVIVFDNNSRINNQPIADKIDLLEVTENGTIKIIKIFTSSIDLSTKKGKKFYDIPHELNNGSFFYNEENSKMSSHEKHSIRMSMQKMLLENMGYQLDFTGPLKSIHIHVGITGSGKNKKFDGNINLSAIKFHDYSIYNDKLTFLKEKEYNPKDQEEDEEYEEIYDEFDDYEDTLEEEQDIENDIFPIGNALESYRKALLKKAEALEKIKDSIYSFRGKEEQKQYIQHALSNIALIEHAGNYTQKKELFTTLVREAYKEVQEFIKYLKNPENVSSDPKYITYVLNARRFAATFQGLYSVKDALFLNDNLKSLLFNLQQGLNELVGNFDGKKNLTDEAIDNYVIDVIQSTTTQDLSRDDVEGIIKYARDIGYGEYISRDWSTSTDTIIRIMNKIFHNAKMEYHDSIDALEEQIKLSAAKLLKLSGTTNRQKLFLYMLNDDGTYVGKTNSKFFSMIQKLHLDCMDENGAPLEYIEEPVTDEDLQWNISLAKKKLKRTQALQPEVKYEDGTYDDGRYYKYTDQFKRIREKFEEFVIDGSGFGTWEIKEGISEKKKLEYRTKLFTEQEYLSPIMIDGEFTGQVQKRKRYFVKSDYVEKRDDVMFIDNEGNEQPMVDPRYEKIMNPTNALEIAQKEFYILFDEIYKSELNAYGPGVFRMMENRIPIMGNRVNSQLDDKGSFFTNMYAKMARKAETFTSDGTNFKNIVLDEEGNIKQTLPMMFIGKTRDEEMLQKVKDQIEELKRQYKNNEITPYDYDKKIADLKGQRDYLVNKPSTKELNLDLASSLLKFMAYAERYKAMDKVEDTLTAMIKVIERRSYKPSDMKSKLGKFTKRGFEEVVPLSGRDSNTLKKAKAFMKMVFYDDEKFSKGLVDKLTDSLINYTSLNYVSANPFGSFNNLVFGKISNYIEAAGGRFFERKAYLRAENEYKKRALQSMIYRTGAAVKKFKGVNYYDPEKAANKYEALAEYFRMMDEKGDLRETAAALGEESKFKKFTNFLYIMQDGTEYNVQSKIGMAILMSTYIKNSKTGDIINLYDAYVFDQETKEPKLKEGFDVLVEKNKRTNKWEEKGIFDNTARYNLRNKIREVNKLIHGNYARDDRMVLQTNFLGKLFAQFHKWVTPAWNSRMGVEYYDENLGWMEGRLKSSWTFTKFIFSQVSKGNLLFGSYREEFFKKYEAGKDRPLTAQEVQRVENKIYGFKKTAGEIMFAFLILAAAEGLKRAVEEDEEEEKKKSPSLSDVSSDREDWIGRRIINFARYQLDRTFKDISLFLPFPFVGSSLEQLYSLFKTPIATTKTLGEIGDFIENLIWYPYGYLTNTEEEFLANKDYFYQRGTRKGQSKLFKNFQDIFPILYGIKKWQDFDNLTNFYIK